MPPSGLQMAESSRQPSARHATGSDDGTVAGLSVSATGEISLSDIHKSFGVTKALDGCNFSASLGEIHAIVGGNGCGKSTLAKVMSGVLPVDSGQVSVIGHTPTSPHEARAAGIATVFQEVLVADECSIVDNLYLGADQLWTKSLPMKAKIREASALMQELAGFELDVEAPIGGFPLSIKQWVTIGRALLANPRVLILDESSAALDLDSTERLFAKMRQLRDQGSAVLIVTHRIAELIRISDRATVLRDGRDVGVLNKGEITEKNLLALMTGRSEAPHITTATATEVLRHDAVLKTSRLKVWPDSRPIDMSLHKGEILGVAGLDGQGQSDFVSALAGINRPAEGVPQVRGADGRFVEIRELADATKNGVSYVSGDRKREGTFANLSIFENLLLPLYRRTARAGKLAVIDWRGLSSIFDWEVDRLSVRMGDRDNKITSLSGGNQQKILIGRAFALNPNILVLNDPARGVDVGAKTELYKHLTLFAERGKSVVYLSSEIEEFVGFATRVIVFRHGSIFDEFAGDSIEPANILEAMFGQSRNGRRDRDDGASEAASVRPHVGGLVEGSAGLPPWMDAPNAVKSDSGEPVYSGRRAYALDRP
jgi:ribose transport system ATP-binding protein